DRPVLVSTTDLAASDATMMYAAVAGYVAQHDQVLASVAATQGVLNTISPLFLSQSAAVRSSASPFASYLASGDLSGGARKVPMVITDEAQFVAAAAAGKLHPDMVLMYPEPNINLQQTILAFSAN